MSAKDTYHDVVRAALERDGWTITHDPLKLRAHGRNVKIDLGAEKLIGAEKEGRKIAVEVKSFVGLSLLSEFYTAVGQCLYYRFTIEEQEPDRLLYLAVPKETYENFFTESLSRKTLEQAQVKLVIYDVDQQQLEQWIS